MMLWPAFSGRLRVHKSANRGVQKKAQEIKQTNKQTKALYISMTQYNLIFVPTFDFETQT